MIHDPVFDNFLVPPLNKTTKFGYVKYETKNNSTFAISKNQVFKSTYIKELKTRNQNAHSEERNCCDIGNVCPKSVASWILLTENYCNFLYEQDFTVWFYDHPHFVSLLIEPAERVDRILNYYRDTVMYKDPIMTNFQLCKISNLP